jgi:hypothetical protein
MSLPELLLTHGCPLSVHKLNEGMLTSYFSDSALSGPGNRNDY